MAVTKTTPTTGAPGATTAFSPTLPTHAAGDRMTLFVLGKYDTTTVPTINQGWTNVGSGTGGTGATGNDVGPTFWVVYQKDAGSSSETAPTVTPGGTAPNSWVWICASHRPSGGAAWLDSIAASAAYVQSASDTNTATPLTGTAGAWTGVQPTANDAIFVVGCVPTDGFTNNGSVTLTVTGLSGGTKDTTTSNYVENSLNADFAAGWCDWLGFTGTASAGAAITFTFAGGTGSNWSGSMVAAALRETTPTPITLTETASGADSLSTILGPDDNQWNYAIATGNGPLY